MSGGCAANCGWIMTFEKAREVAPAAMEEFEEALDEYGRENDADLRGGLYDSGLEAWANGDASLAINAAFNKLAAAVEALTGGLEISAMYYSPDIGDRYDDIEWPCFWVDGVKDFTPSGLAAFRAGLIASASWVTWG